MNAKERLEELHKQGITVYSFSRLNSFHNCEFEYYNTYVKKNRGLDNCYTVMGSCLHSNVEGIYDGINTIDKFKEDFNEKLIELEMCDLDFPNKNIKNSWVNDISHFINNFNKINKKMAQEQLIVFEAAPGIYLQGFIDCVMPSDKGKPYVHVLDWKTSSKFSGKKLKEAGRQLLMYKIGLEDNSNYKVDKIMWFMMKYLYVCNMQKNGKVKKKMCNRGKWVKQMKEQLEKELYKCDIDDFEVDLLLDKAIEDNDIECLPQQIKDKFWLEDCFVEYDASDDKIDELRQYISNTVQAIESKDKNNEDEWKPVEITKYNSFYCSTLCSHRKTCQFYKAFLEENADSFGKKKNEEDDLFG